MKASLNRLLPAVVSAAVLPLVSLFLSGCTTIPQRELETYHKVFDQVRVQSETVIADYAVGQQAKSNLVARMVQRKQPVVGAAQLDALLNIQSFDARAAGANVQSDIDMRLKAWEVAAKYNEALLALAAGKSGEIETAVNGFLESLKKFPIKEVSQAAAEAVPYAGAIIPILELVQKEVEARRFRHAVIDAGPYMQKFVNALYDDANLFYKYRKAYLNDRFKFEEESFIAEAVMDFQATLNAHPQRRPRHSQPLDAS